MSRKLMFFKLIVEVIVALLIVLWIYTGISKIMDYTNFKFNLGRSPFIQSIAGLIAIAIPAIELSLATLLVFKRTRLVGLFGSFALMTAFTGYIWLMLHYAYDLPCSCGGVLASLTWQNHLIFNAVFTVLALIGVIFQSKVSNPSQAGNALPIKLKI